MNTRQLAGSVLDALLRIVIIVAVVMFVYKYALKAYDFGYRVFAEPPVTTQENARTISIAVSEDATPEDIGRVLEEKGLIEDAKLFTVQELLSTYHGEIRPGIYELSSHMTAEEMMVVMSTAPEEDEAAAAGSDAVGNAGETGDTEAEDGAETQDNTGAEDGAGTQDGVGEATPEEDAVTAGEDGQ